jgi:hypothetical protein
MPDISVIGQIPASADTPAPATPEVSASNTPPVAEERPVKALPTDRLSFPKQLEVLRAYAVASGQTGKAVTNSDLANLTKLNVSSAGLNNSFFSEIGLITKSGNGYVPATEVVNFNRQWGYNTSTAGHKLAPALRRTWFGEIICSRLQMRPMTDKEAIGELADEAKAGQRYASQLSTLLDYLETAGLVTQEGGMVRQGVMIRAADEPARTEPASEATPMVPVPTPPPMGAVSTGFASAPEGAVKFHVDVTVDMKEMATWKPEVVAAFFAGVAQVISAKAMVERAAGTR